jgi:Undecaprenyl-phosphate glucose phosphotransferase
MGHPSLRGAAALKPGAALQPMRKAAARPVSLRRRARAAKYWFEIGFSYLAGAGDFFAILASASAANTIYGFATLGLEPPVESVAGIGIIVGLFVALANFQRSDYSLKKYSSTSGHFARCFPIWNLAFLLTLALGFATKTTDIFSRGATAAFYICGLLSLAGARVLLVALVNLMRARGSLPLRRLCVVGFEQPSREFAQRYQLSESGMEIVSVFALREGARDLSDDLALAGAAIRMLRPDDIFLTLPWSEADVIEACVDAFVRTPAEIHLSPEVILDRYQDARVTNLGALSSLSLTRAPMSALQHAEKRVMDVVIASAALLALTPLFALAALAIKLDGRGPVLFLQTRYGFNQEPFRIVKFRTMRVMQDDRGVMAATRGDARVTRFGAILRRFSIDELPQLLNVLKGDMSLVGPRPHAMAHDQQYERKIARYARRHNVKPGITGWAQVHGYRGEIRCDENLAGRIERDLYYIDNWSMWLDVKILALTLLSAKTHRNAY